MKYVKRPIPVEAFLWHGETNCPGMPPGTIHDVYELLPDGSVGGLINTLEARQLNIRSGEHYIVGSGAGGEYWPVRKDIFEATYIAALTPLAVAENLRSSVERLRRTSMPLADLIPVLQRAADLLDGGESS